MKSHQFTSQKYTYSFPLLNKLPADQPGIYSLCGAFGVGKTTLLKLWVEKLLTQGVAENAIAFIETEKLEDYHALNRSLQKQLALMPQDVTLYLIVDDITAIRYWMKAIVPLAHANVLNHVILMLSGSNTNLKSTLDLKLKEYRGPAQESDFHLYPLTFREVVLLKHGNSHTPEILYEEFNQYLQTGGYLKVINELASEGYIKDETLSTHGDHLIKEILKRGKQERYLREILSSVITHYNQQITWNALAEELTIDHTKTIGDYFEILEKLEIVFIQYALLEETLKPAPKKARKLMFTDPFIFHVIQAWLSQTKNYYEKEIKPALNNTELSSKLVEACVITHFKRYYPTYYIKAEGEVDLAYIDEHRFWPIETTWTSRIRAKDLKQTLKYPNSRILTKTERSGIIEHIRTEPLPLALWQLGDTNT